MSAALVVATCRCCGGEVCRSVVLDVWFHRAQPAAGHVPDPVPCPRVAADGGVCGNDGQAECTAEHLPEVPRG